MEKGLLFFTLSIACLWVILDEFFGTKKLSNAVKQLTPDIQSPGEFIGEKVDQALNGTETPSDKIEDRDNVKQKVDDNKNMNKTQKQNIKEAVDKFYLQGFGVDSA